MSNDLNSTSRKRKSNEIEQPSKSLASSVNWKPQNLKQTASEGKGETKPKSTLSAADVFGDDSDDETEEMPFQAKLRLKNLGKQTPTSTGPNSFGKVTGRGFIDPRVQWKKVIEETKKKTDEEEDRVKGKGSRPSSD